MSGWKWWRTLERHESVLWTGAFGLTQDVPHFFSPLLQGVVIGLLSATMLVSIRRRFLLLTLLTAVALWQAARMTPLAPVPAYQLRIVVGPVFVGLLVLLARFYRWRNSRDDHRTAQA